MIEEDVGAHMTMGMVMGNNYGGDNVSMRMMRNYGDGDNETM